MSSAAQPRDLGSVLAAAQLPALPQSAIQLLQLSQNPKSGPNDFAKPIEADPGLMGQVLRFVNSSYFGFTRQIGSIPQALQLVGVRSITNFALWSAVFSLIPNPQFGAFNLRSLWQDSLRRAIFARRLGKKLALTDAEDLFAAALLQDMAIPLLLKELPEWYKALVERRASEGQRLSALEREAFGWDHADAAAALVRNWNLPDSFAKLIEKHTHLDALLASSPPERAAACVALASMLPSCADNQWDESEAFLQGYAKIIGAQSISLDELISETDSGMEDFAPLLKLPVPKKKLVEWMQETQATA
jgi:HD-like signal output (HDOD) protein